MKGVAAMRVDVAVGGSAPCGRARMWLWRSALLATMAAFLSTGCGQTSGSKPSTAESASPEAAPVDEFYPLAIGARWTYREAVLDRETGREKEHHTLTVRVDRADGDRFAMVEERDGQLVSEYRQAVGDEGILTWDFETSDEAHLLFKTPLTVGLDWKVAKDRRAVVVSEELFTLEGRSIPSYAVHYERFYDKQWAGEPRWLDDGLLWFAPGVGVVKRDMRKAVTPSLRGRSVPTIPVSPAGPGAGSGAAPGVTTTTLVELVRFERAAATSRPASGP